MLVSDHLPPVPAGHLLRAPRRSDPKQGEEDSGHPLQRLLLSTPNPLKLLSTQEAALEAPLRSALEEAPQSARVSRRPLSQEPKADQA